MNYYQLDEFGIIMLNACSSYVNPIQEEAVASVKLKELMKRADELTADEKLELALHLIEQARQGDDSQPRRKWREINGAAQYPMVGEDAQAWVSRSRQESEREVQYGELPK